MIPSVPNRDKYCFHLLASTINKQIEINVPIKPKTIGIKIIVSTLISIFYAKLNIRNEIPIEVNIMINGYLGFSGMPNAKTKVINNAPRFIQRTNPKRNVSLSLISISYTPQYSFHY